MTTLYYHSDDGCRKGCHPVSIQYPHRGKPHNQHVFSIDEPGAWWADDWNLHVDGQDILCASKEEAVRRGAEVLGIDDYIVVEVGAFFTR